ncbi:MAG: YqeG family HAD IIIA-type phosphatase [Thermoflexaceae bacterium]|nr:YqeG family HAD IIIA-type phosphatase [Thermoflexaceae bacterium]
MLDMFYPDEYLDSTYGIDFQKFRKEGYKGIIFDIDNTLVMHGEPADSQAVELFERLRSLGFDTCLLSNNKRPRVESFAEQVNSKFIFKADKPSKKGYRKAMELMETGTDNTLFIGDQLFTDVWGAKRAGIRSILVKPINPREEIQIVLKRYLEKIVLYFYQRKRKG